MIASTASVMSTGRGKHPFRMNLARRAADDSGIQCFSVAFLSDAASISLGFCSECLLLERFLLAGRKRTSCDGDGAVNCVNNRKHARLTDSFDGTPQISRMESASLVCVSRRYHNGSLAPKGTESLPARVTCVRQCLGQRVTVVCSRHYTNPLQGVVQTQHHSERTFT